MGVFIFKTRVGVRLMRKHAVVKASLQKRGETTVETVRGAAGAVTEGAMAAVDAAKPASATSSATSGAVAEGATAAVDGAAAVWATSACPGEVAAGGSTKREPTLRVPIGA